jgi:aryl-alcohol dehydrogenase-like predicted oxidoreductase
LESSRRRLIPGTDYSYSEVLVGLWQLSVGHAQNPAAKEQVFCQLERLALNGCSSFDVADIYTGAEKLLGQFLRERGPGLRARGISLQVHTKFVPDLDVLNGLSKAYVESIVDRSLRRLGIEQLDLVQLSWWNYEIPGYVEAGLWLKELQSAGKIRHLGATNFDTPRLHELLAAGVPLRTHQVQFSVLDQRPLHAMAQLCATHNVGLLCYGTLAGGFLTDRYLNQPPPTSLSNRSLIKYRLIIDEFGGWKLFQQTLQALAQVARRHATTVASVAVQYILTQPTVCGVILGLPHGDRTEFTPSAFELSKQDLDVLNRVLAGRRGPSGDCFALERNTDGPHAAIMRYNLNAAQQSGTE